MDWSELPAGLSAHISATANCPDISNYHITRTSNTRTYKQGDRLVANPQKNSFPPFSVQTTSKIMTGGPPTVLI